MGYTIKRATVMATLRKVDLHASSPSQLFISAKSKISEFLRKGYPAGILRYMTPRLSKGKYTGPTTAAGALSKTHV